MISRKTFYVFEKTHLIINNILTKDCEIFKSVLALVL